MRTKSAFTIIELIALIAIILFLTLFGVPAFQNIFLQSREQAIQENMQHFVEAGRRYLAQSNESSITYEKLVPEYLQPLSPVMDESYEELVLFSGGGILTIQTRKLLVELPY